MKQSVGRRVARAGAFVALTGVLAVAAGCGGGEESSSAAGGEKAAKALDPNALGPKEIVGKGPNGEPAASPDDVTLTAEDAEKLKKGGYEVGVILQTGDIDWSKIQVRAIKATLAKYGVKVTGVVDPQMKVDKQIAGIEDMIQRKPDAIIAIPVDNTATGPTFKKVSQAGIKLILMDNVPKGLKHPTDYQAMVSADSQGNGRVAAEVLANEIPEGGTIGIVGFGVDFFVTNERVIGVQDWLKENRPDIKIKKVDFTNPGDANSVTENFLTANPDVQGLFVVWDAPAMGAATAVRTVGKNIPITTIDLGLQAAADMASKDGLIKGIGAQRPYDQGVTESMAAMRAILGKESPAWVGVPSLGVIASNVTEAYKEVWKEDAPKELVDACKANPECGG